MSTDCGAGENDTAYAGQGDRSHGAGATLTPLQKHYLHQLQHMITLKHSYVDDSRHEEWILRAVSKAAYSAFNSCVEHGLGPEAKAFLARQHETN
jgi:hypothetical protein